MNRVDPIQPRRRGVPVVPPVPPPAAPRDETDTDRDRERRRSRRVAPPTGSAGPPSPADRVDVRA